MEIRDPYLGRAPEPADSLDCASFKEQYDSITARAGDAIDGGDTQIVAGYITELALLCVANPQLARALEARSRWKVIDSDL